MEQTSEEDQIRQVDKFLKYYVYVYSDPRDGKPFYIGKGTGNRWRSHLTDQSESKKVEKIQELEKAHLPPKIDILRYGLTDSEAHLVEAAAIDLIGRPPLTNIVRGKHPSPGPITSQDLDFILNPKPGTVDHKAILITINKLYRSNMTPLELYEATRGIWKIGPRRVGAEFAMAVFQGIVREVYRIKEWHPSGTLKYETRDSWEVDEDGDTGRWEFSGEVAEDEIRNKYVGIFVGKSGQNPIRYVNV